MRPAIASLNSAIYLRARYYDPTTGQFLRRDPLESLTREPYAYAGNNPINNTDPTGLYWGEGIVEEIIRPPARPSPMAPGGRATSRSASRTPRSERTSRASARQAEVLRKAVMKHAPELEQAIQRFPQALSAAERDAFEDCLSCEFTLTGLLPSDEPNERGLLIEGVIDILMRAATDRPLHNDDTAN